MNEISTFLSQVFDEMKKICWPKREEFVIAFVSTLLLVTFFSFFFAAVDTTIVYIIKRIVYFFA